MEQLLPLATELVKGVAAPLTAGSPFYILMESSGSDAERLRGDLEKLLEEALGEEIILDATIASSGAAAAAIWRVRDSSVEVSRATAPSVGSDISLAIDQMEPFTNAIEKAIKKIDKDAIMIVFGHVGDGNLHVNAKYSPPADKNEEMKEIIYGTPPISAVRSRPSTASASASGRISSSAAPPRRSRPCAR